MDKKEIIVKFPRMPRNGLRPVSIHNKDAEVKYGFFHCFGHEGSMDDGVGLFATVEMIDGTVAQYDAYKIKFDDIPDVIANELL